MSDDAEGILQGGLGMAMGGNPYLMGANVLAGMYARNQAGKAGGTMAGAYGQAGQAMTDWFNTGQAATAPWRQAGEAAQNQINMMLGLPSYTTESFQNYQQGIGDYERQEALKEFSTRAIAEGSGGDSINSKKAAAMAAQQHGLSYEEQKQYEDYIKRQKFQKDIEKGQAEGAGKFSRTQAVASQKALDRMGDAGLDVPEWMSGGIEKPELETVDPEQAQAEMMKKLQSSPGYKFQLEQGQQALEGAGWAGGQVGGQLGKDLVGYGQNLANQTFQQQLANLGGVSSTGFTGATNFASGAQNLGAGIGQTMIGAGQAQAGAQINQANAISNMVNQGMFGAAMFGKPQSTGIGNGQGGRGTSTWNWPAGWENA